MKCVVMPNAKFHWTVLLFLTNAVLIFISSWPCCIEHGILVLWSGTESLSPLQFLTTGLPGKRWTMQAFLFSTSSAKEMILSDFFDPGGSCSFVTKLSLTLLTPWTEDHQAPLQDFPGKSARVGCPFLLLGIFPTQGLNPQLLHCSWILNFWATREAPIDPTCSFWVNFLGDWKILRSSLWLFYIPFHMPSSVFCPLFNLFLYTNTYWVFPMSRHCSRTWAHGGENAALLELTTDQLKQTPPTIALGPRWERLKTRTESSSTHCLIWPPLPTPLIKKKALL